MNAPHAYGSVARSFHWLIAILLVLQIPLAFYMLDQPLGPDKLGNYATHKSIGLLIFSVTALRLAWRLTHPAPPLPAATGRVGRHPGPAEQSCPPPAGSRPVRTACPPRAPR